MSAVKNDASSSAAPIPPFDVARWRRDFPALEQRVHGHPLVYLDNAATTQKPQAVIDAVVRYYREDCSNVHRGVHQLSQRSTLAFEAARERVRAFLGAHHTEEVIFVRGATEGINLVARSFLGPRLQEGDEVLVTAMEHHANIVPWQLVCEEKGAQLAVIPMNDRGEISLDEAEALISPRTKLVAAVHVSNALGTINPVKGLVDAAHQRGIPVLLDGAQAAPHLELDVAALDCEFYVFSGHKVFGPTGIGVLYGKRELLEAMPPYQGGGDMIRSVSFEKTEFNVPPHRFEAGTPNIAGTIGLAAALDYLSGIGLGAVAAYESELLHYATEQLLGVPGVRLIGTAKEKASVASFVIEGVHAHDVGTILDQQGIAVRVGHHCAQPVMDRFGVTSTVRASVSFYNTHDEIDALIGGLEEVLEIFRP
ncbi:MAG: cysteine desulfurase [Deltaproteobacteria bacterium]|nr:cysteine desulfurase [Deltaproteobacteria bacterium]